MMHTKEARVKGLCKDHIVKLAPVGCSGAMKIATKMGKWRGLQQRIKSITHL